MGVQSIAERDSLFYGGPSLRLEAQLRMCRPRDDRVLRRAALVAAVGWLPLVLLAAVQPLFLPVAGLSTLASDVAVHCRSLIAAPCFVLAEATCTPRLAAIAQHFVDAELIPEGERARYEAARASTRRLRDSPLAEALVVFAAYAVILALLLAQVPTVPWHQNRSGVLGPHSPAGWWNLLVSLPLLLTLFFGWLWRLFLWARFLWLMSRLDLVLIAAHSDLSAGLMFVSYSIRAFSPVALGLATIFAGSVANGVLIHGRALLSYRAAVLGLVVFVVVAFCSPVLVFVGRLRRVWLDGVFRYGAIAGGLGREFERKWLTGRRIRASALEAPDFSQVADLNQVVANVHAMKLIPLDLRSVLLLVVATLLPFLPVAVVSLPFGTLLQTLAKLLI